MLVTLTHASLSAIESCWSHLRCSLESSPIHGLSLLLKKTNHIARLCLGVLLLYLACTTVRDTIDIITQYMNAGNQVVEISTRKVTNTNYTQGSLCITIPYAWIDRSDYELPMDLSALNLSIWNSSADSDMPVQTPINDRFAVGLFIYFSAEIEA